MSEKVFLGLDIGTDSVGWAVTNEEYKLKKFRGEPMWGSVLFEAANLKAERRAFRISRRRLQRRKQRVLLLQELFAKEIAKVDPGFYKRLQASALYREDAGEPYSVFDDDDYTDREYHKQYPTIHHLIVELMESDSPHDIRLVYMACAWLMAHRGHFLSEVSKDNIAALTDFEAVYSAFKEYICSLSEEFSLPWNDENRSAFERILPQKITVKRKYDELVEALFEGGKCSKEVSDAFPFRCDILLKALCGSKISAKELFNNPAYEELDSFTLGSDDELLASLMIDLGEDGELIHHLKQIYDWAILKEVLSGHRSISLAKVEIYEQHKSDLQSLKYLVKKYLPEQYSEVFREATPGAYTSYVKHAKNTKKVPDKWSGKEAFSDYIKKLLKRMDGKIVDCDQELFQAIVARNDIQAFLPKQKDTDNRVIPYQLYYSELSEMLKRVAQYHPFLNEKDECGLSVSEKILSVFEFRIPYFVGPLNVHSSHGWIKRKAEGKIYPWNFKEMVDLDQSESEFIQRMLNTCTYLAGEKCVPKESLLYRKYMVLNEINNIRINGVRIPVELKQDIYQDLFCQYKKVSRKRIDDYLLSRGVIESSEAISGLDTQINAQLKSYHDFRRLMENHVLTEAEVEEIVERSTFSEDGHRFSKWVRERFPQLKEEDAKYVSKLRYKEFGRLSKRFLNELEGVNKETGEISTIVGFLWNTNCNLMEILSDSFDFKKNIDEMNKDYYADPSHHLTLEKRLEDMYISNAVKRPILRTMEVVKEVTKACGKAPDRIFIEMARGASEEQKHKRTKTRKDQILELYKQCKDQDVRDLQRQLEAMDMADNRLQSDKLFLYYLQLGKSIYSGKPIELEQLGSKLYDIDHIYPQRMVKDDSIINNKVLCLSEENGFKKDNYPVPEAWRKSQRDFWERLKKAGLMSEEKYKRLTRETGFTADEQMGFINRQLTETSQSTKAVATLLKEKYPNTEIVYVKARITSEFRQYIKRYKSRTFNDLHHAKDAYLNIVTGNVYHLRFSKNWFSLEKEPDYSLNMHALFGDKAWAARNGEAAWGGGTMLANIKKTVEKNNGHLTQYAFCRHGGYFDQMPVKKGIDYIPRKRDLSTDKYGGYNKASASYFMLVKYKAGKEEDVIIMPVELLYAGQVETDNSFAENYAKRQIGIIRNKTVEEVSFPLGIRKLKINTVFSLDGFRVTLGGKASGGNMVIVSGNTPFSASGEWQNYTSHIESFLQKTRNNKALIYSPDFDRVERKKNIELYDIYMDKLSKGIFEKRYNSPLVSLKNGRELFTELSEVEQAKVLQSIHQLFGRLSGGVDLTGIGGKGRAGATFPSSLISSWGKKYKDVRILDTSVTGIWERSSDNLLNLL